MIPILLPFLAMHFCTYVIIGPKGEIDTQVSEALAPFDESLEVEPYKVYLEDAEIERMARHYGIEKNNRQALIEKIDDWRGRPGGMDDVGLFCVTNVNPHGRWDWYEIGGRWNGEFRGRNVVTVKTLLKRANSKSDLPYYVLAPDGEWHEVETLFDAGYCKFESVRKSAGRWLIEVKQVLTRYPNHRVVCVDIHR